MFEIFPWNPQLETGLAEIDAQHRVLVRLLNQLAQAHVQGGSAEQVRAVLAELARYTQYHFSTEEGIWRSALAGDAWFEAHVAAHKGFIAHIEALTADSRAWADILDELFGFLSQWLAFHILDNDKRMALALRAVQAGERLAQAREHADAQMQGAGALLIQTVLQMYRAVCAQAIELMKEKLARQQAEAALQSGEQRWAFLRDLQRDWPGVGTMAQQLGRIVEHLPAGVLVAELNSRRLVFANPHAARLLGYDTDALLRLTLSDLHPPYCANQIEADLQALHGPASPHPLERPTLHQDGHTFTASVARSVLRLGDQPVLISVLTEVGPPLAPPAPGSVAGLARHAQPDARSQPTAPKPPTDPGTELA